MGRKLIPLDEAKSIIEPIVYGLSRNDGAVVYVGMTRRARRRFSCYANVKRCHNPALRDWLSNGVCFVSILHTGEAGLVEAEARFIKMWKDRLFNAVHGGEQNWRNFESNPWTGSTGAQCPSSILLRHLGVQCQSSKTKALIRDVTEMRGKMDRARRVCFEASLAVEYWGHPAFGKTIAKWHNVAGGKMCREIERLGLLKHG